MSKTINWFEIPTRNMDLAVRFYEATLGAPIRRELFGGVPHGVFAHSGESIGGALVDAGARQPGAAGALVYFNCKDGVPATLERASAAGGVIVLPVTSIGEQGWIAVIRDLDGNEVGLHAEPSAS